MALVLPGKLDFEDFEEDRHMATYCKRLPLVENIHHNESVSLIDSNESNREEETHNFSPKLQSPRKNIFPIDNHITNGTTDDLSCLANICETESMSPHKKSKNEHSDPALSKHETTEKMRQCNQKSSGYLQNKENCISPKFQSPRKRHHSSESHSTNGNSANLSYLATVCETQAVTPKKKSNSEHYEPPLTPTANLKMLFSAVSPELRRRDQLREETNKCRQCLTTQVEEEDMVSSKLTFSDSPSVSDAETKMFTTGSRKEKSLGLLCQKFLAKYPVYPEQNCNIDISLDEVAKDLAVERRRIYDIVNVLESVEIVSRVAKNKYAWHGKTNLCNTLAKLKALAEREGFKEQMKKIKDYERKKGFTEKVRYSYAVEYHFERASSEEVFSNNIPKFLEKSLGIMSQKFLMLFLVLKPKTVNLDLAAKILIGDMTVDKTESSKFKTKIRRLYDIANILTSLDLIKKVHVTEIRGRKPAFKYIGPEIDNATDINICSTDGCHRPSSRHSLLDCVKNQKIAHILNKTGKRAISRAVGSQDDMFAENGASGNGKKSFSRHASFDSICEVAEKERTKLFSVKPSTLSTSQPCSPSKEKNLPQWKPFLTPKDNPQQIIWVQKGNKIHEYHVIPSPGHPLPMTTTTPLITTTPLAKNDSCIQTPVSIPSLTSNHTLVATHNVPASSAASKILPSAAESSPLAPGALLKPSANNQLTEEQMNAVLKSLKDPVPVSAHSGSSLVDASTQSSPPANQQVETSSAQSECEDAEKSAKKSQLKDSTGSSSKTGTGENGKRQSPIRVLHLEPEFNMDKNTQADSDKSLETGDSKDDLAVPLGSEQSDLDKCFKPISAPVMPTLSHSCSCYLSTHSIHTAQPATPKLVQLSNQASPSSVMQLPLFAVASVTASPAQVTNSFAYTGTDSNMSSRGMKIHQLPSPHILTFSPVPAIGIADNSQPSQTLVAFPVSQPTMNLASVQLIQSSCNASGQGNVQMKTPTPLTMHNPSTTPGGQISFQSPDSVLGNITFATPGSFFRNTPNLSSSQQSLLAEFKRASPIGQTHEKQPVCAGSAARRLNLIESP